MNKLILIIIISLISIPSLIFAQNSVSNDEYTLLEPLPCVSGYSGSNPCDTGNTIPKINFSDYISYAYRLAIALSVFLAIVMIMWGGFEYMTSEIPSTKSDGKTRMTDAIIGLLLVLSSYLILETIDPRLVAVNTELQKVQVNTRDSKLLRSRLGNDLQKISTEKQFNANELEKKLIDLENKKSEIEKKMDGSEIDSAAMSQYIIESEKIKTEIRQTKVEKNKFLAESIGAYKYRDASITIYEKGNIFNNEELILNTDNSKANLLVNGKYPTNTPNPIQNSYNEKINEIATLDPESARILSLQRNFYINQIKEDIELKKELNKHGSAKYSGPVTAPTLNSGVVDNSVVLNKRLESYEKDLKDKNKIINSGLSETEYNSIILGKMEQINKVLGNK